MSLLDEPNVMIAMGTGPFDTYQGGEYSLLAALRGTSDRYGLGANVDWAVSRFGVKEKLEQYGIQTEQLVRVNTGEIYNHDVGSGPPRPFVMWHQYLPGDVRMMICSKITIEDTGDSKLLFDGDMFARDIVTGIPKIVLLFQDNDYGKSALPDTELMHWDYTENGVFHLPRDMRSDRSIQASLGAMDQLVKGLWTSGFDFPFQTYREIAASAVVKC